MVLLTIVTQNNGETIFLDEPIPQVHFMKLISCSLFNSWDTLKNQSIVIMGDEKSPVETSTILPGHYTLENLEELINGMFPSLLTKHFEKKINTAEATLQIITNLEIKFSFSRDFNNILGIDDALKKKNKRKTPQISNSLLHSL